MGRRSTLVAFAAIAATLLPATAYAAAPATNLALQTGFASTVTITWTPSAADPPLTQAVYRNAGGCGAAPTGSPFASGDGTLASATEPGVPDGVWCYYVESSNIGVPLVAYAAISVTVDTTAPTAPAPGVAPASLLRGAATITANSTDLTGTTNVLHAGTLGCDALSPVITSPWTAAFDGTYLICYVATDGAGHTTLSPPTAVVVDNTPPTGEILTPAPGAFVSGNAVALTANAADATAGIGGVQWQRLNNAGNWVGILQPTGNAGNNYLRNWNSTLAAVGDGPDSLRAVVTDNAGNEFITGTTTVTVDNTPPDGAAVLTGPPAVAGSPTLSWTPAHDAIGIVRYDVVRGASVIGTVGDVDGAQTYSFNDQNAPDQATSSYTVRAYDATNHFINSAAVSVLVDSKAQSAPHTLAAATPTAAPPVLTWQAPVTFNVDHYDVWRDGLLLASTVGAALTYTDATAAEGVHDYAVLARSPSSQPGVLSSSFKVLLDVTPPTSGGAPTAQVLPAGAVQLAWPAADDALSGVAGYIVRRAAGGIPPAAADGGTAVCAPTATDCADAATASGTWSYGVFARDLAGNVALIGTVAGVVINDKTAPLAPTKLSLSLVQTKSKKPSTNLTYTLRWVKPTAPDLDRVVVVLNLKRAPTQPADGKAIYKGLGTSTKVKVRAGQTAYLALFAYDHSGNVSAKPARKVIRLASLIPLRPLSGSVVRSSSPLLTWKAKKGTVYYNLQLFVNGKRVLVGWPSHAAYRIPAGKLSPGTYVWYVWPAIKHKGSTPTFGKLIGRATFTYKK